jgi:glycerophosphoryl diester phosphodiesterase
LHRKIGIVPELKHSTYFRSIGLPLEERFIAQMRANHLDDRDAKVTVQSFEIGNLKVLHHELPGVPLVQLLDAKNLKPGDVLAAGGTTTYGQMATPAGLREIAKYADVASPSKDYIVPRDTAGASQPPTTFIDDAHRAGLDVVAYTFRAENQFLPLELRSSANPNEYGNLFGELKQFFDLGIDGVFTDNADIAKATRDGE